MDKTLPAKNSSKTFLSYFTYSILAFTIAFLGASFFIHQSQTFCANSVSCIKDLSVRVENNATGIFEGEKVKPPKITIIQEKTQEPKISGEKHIYVDLSSQTLYAYQGDTQILKTLISSGKWHPTPTGDFHIWTTLRSTRMSGGSGDDAYDLPNVPYTMFFYNDEVPKGAGFALHGAYWHDNFGHPMSHGCVNLRISDAQILYDWVGTNTPETLVSICSQIVVKNHARECIQ